MSLSVYLKELLKTNDCVIIPDLGGFIANYQSSVSNSQGDQFYPPTKEIIFNGKLKKNDGLLVNYICEKDGVGYLEARKIVSEFVSECQFRLENGQQVEFDQVGTLIFDQNEHLSFEAKQGENLRTDTFGLDSFHFPPLVSKFSQPPKPVFRDKEPVPQEQRRPILKYLLLVVPILAALYFIPKIITREPANRPLTSNTATLSITDTPVTIHSEAVPPANAHSEAKAEEKGSGDEVNETAQISEQISSEKDANAIPKIIPQKAPQPEENIAQTIVNESQKGKFHLVGGCFKIRENADKLAGKLIKEGFPARVSNMGKSFYRVTAQSFQTRAEAEEAMKKIYAADPNATYWLMVDRR
jgi:cell division protein FtsN